MSDPLYDQARETARGWTMDPWQEQVLDRWGLDSSTVARMLHDCPPLPVLTTTRPQDCGCGASTVAQVQHHEDCAAVCWCRGEYPGQPAHPRCPQHGPRRRR